MPSDKVITQRLNELETSWGLLQRDFEAQNEMILLNNKKIQQLESMVQRMHEKLSREPSDTSPATLDEEKPPHY